MKAIDPNRIALFIPTLEVGGTERIFLNLADGFQKAGFQVDLLLKKKIGAFTQFIPAGIRVIDLNAPRMFWTLTGLVRYLRASRPKALLAGLDLPNLLAVMAKKLAFCPTRVVVSIRSVVSRQGKVALYPRWLDRIFMRAVYSQADVIVAVSKAVACDFAAFTRMPLDRIQVIYNPAIRLDLGKKSHQKFEHPWFGPGQLPVILSVGRLEPVKDFFNLVRAFAIVHARTRVRLVILGEGKDRSKLEKLVRKLGLEEDVWLAGFHTNPYALMRQATVFVLSSRHDASPNVLVEAMACGCPVVCTDSVGGSREIINSGQFGHLVPVDDPLAMAEAILAVLEGDVRRPTEDWLSQFVQENVIEKYLALF